MSAIFDVMLIIVALFSTLLIFRGLHKNNKKTEQYDILLSIHYAEDHFGLLINKITTPFYWFVHHEYNDFFRRQLKR